MPNAIILVTPSFPTNLPNSHILSLPNNRSTPVGTSCGPNVPWFDFRYWLEIIALAVPGPTQTQIYWKPRALQQTGLNLTSHLPLRTRLRMGGAFSALSACLRGEGGDGGQEGSWTGGSQGMKVPRAVCSGCRT